jgi:hypothetical protein
MLMSYLETYLVDHRAGIVALRHADPGASGDALWLSMYGPPMTDNGIYDRIVARTRERFGQPINPHLFRDSAATSIAIDDPAHIGVASRLLGHRTASTTECYYNQARSIEASRLVQNHLLALRRSAPDAIDLKKDPITGHRAVQGSVKKVVVVQPCRLPTDHCPSMLRFPNGTARGPLLRSQRQAAASNHGPANPQNASGCRSTCDDAERTSATRLSRHEVKKP